MKIHEIKPGRKYYHTLAIGSKVGRGSRKKERQTSAIIVVEVNQETKKVCASVNGFPAEWFTSDKYARWTDVKPEQSKPISL